MTTRLAGSAAKMHGNCDTRARLLAVGNRKILGVIILSQDHENAEVLLLIFLRSCAGRATKKSQRGIESRICVEKAIIIINRRHWN